MSAYIDGPSPWDDERPENTRSSPLTLPADEAMDAFKDASETPPISDIKPSETLTSPSDTPKTATARRNPRRPARHIARVEAVAIDDDLGPLGPLGDNFNVTSEPSTPQHYETPPEPPQKEVSPRTFRGTSTAVSQISMRGEHMDSVSLDDDDNVGILGTPRKPPPVIGGSPERITGAGPANAPVEATLPTFDITVGDPHKVGDLTSAHTAYQVRTKTTSKAYRQNEFTVSRRYRDFLWLYNSLINNNPGVVVPPPPEKQALGRFDDNFVESRRAALERMLMKTAVHPILQNDGDLKLFLESEALNVDIKQKEKQTPLVGESKGMFGFGNAFSVGTKNFIEGDEWFHDRKQYLEALETQLKALVKAVDTVVKQRKDLADAAGDFSSSLHALSTVELNASLSSPLEALSDLQLRIKELHERQAAQDVLTLGITVDEYIRLIGSIKLAFTQRQKAFQNWHVAEGELVKRRYTLEKLNRQGKTQQDRLTQLSAEVQDSEKKVHQARLLFDDMGRLMKSELDRFEREKVEDFKSGVETFLESSVEAQKELIELWETYLMQLDREEGELQLQQQQQQQQQQGVYTEESTTEPTITTTPTATV